MLINFCFYSALKLPICITVLSLCFVLRLLSHIKLLICVLNTVFFVFVNCIYTTVELVKCCSAYTFVMCK